LATFDAHYRVHGKDALSKLRDPGIRKPHAILCDLHMDQMDGL